MLTRQVDVIRSPTSDSSNEPVPFRSKLDNQNIILLGDPGSGKSYLFDKACEYEGGKFFTARKFLIYSDKSIKGKTIYIDGLDEKRSRTDSVQDIDQIITRINEYKPQKLRISCRSADWLGETDLEAFRPYFRLNGNYSVLALKPLSTEEIDSILRLSGEANPAEFRKMAESKNVAFLLTNPQTLTLLIKSVSKGSWPSTKKELFKIATKILLEEHNNTHVRSKLGKISADSLMESAGFASAIMLIADVQAISLKSHSTDNGIPSYSNIPLSNKKMLAALTRRAFTYFDDESVSYIHRTIAEFLAAKWIANSIKEGLSFRRVLSLLMTNQRPAAELRGLVAWLAVFLPTYAKNLIANDPYGVLTYGDVASLSAEHRQFLLIKLSELSDKDPWFRKNDWSGEQFGALSGPGMFNHFRKILSTANNSHLRSIVFDAITHGQPAPELIPELLKILCSESCYYSERRAAYTALTKILPEGIEEVINAAKGVLAKQESSTRLRARIVADLYIDNFKVEDAVSIISDYTMGSQETVFGQFLPFVRGIPLDDLPNFLDSLSELSILSGSENYTDQFHEVISIYTSALESILNQKNTPPTEHIYSWLNTLAKFYPSNRSEIVKQWLNANPSKVMEMYKTQLATVTDNNNCQEMWYQFSKTVMNTYDTKKLIEFTFNKIKDNRNIDDRTIGVYEFVLSVTVHQLQDINLFKQIYEYGDQYTELKSSIKRQCQLSLDDWRHTQKTEALEKSKIDSQNKQENRASFLKASNLIQNGSDMGWMSWIAIVYFGNYNHSSQTNETGKSRLILELGESRTKVALQGLQALIKKSDLPSPNEIGRIYASGKYYGWWIAIIAGLDESWGSNPKLSNYSIALLEAALAIDLLKPTRIDVENDPDSSKREWKSTALKSSPDLVLKTYDTVIREDLKAGGSPDHLLYQVLNEDVFNNKKGRFAFDLLTDFPSITELTTKELLVAVASEIDLHKNIVKLGLENLNKKSKLRGRNRALWYSIIFLLDFSQFKATGQRFVSKNTDNLQSLKAIIRRVEDVNKDENKIKLSVQQTVYLIKSFAKLYPKTGHSDTNHSWETEQFIGRLINELSNNTSQNAQSALEQLIKESALSSYQNNLKSAHSSQLYLYWQNQYEQPNFNKTIISLKGKSPAHIGDLFALTVDYLISISSILNSGNTDQFKVFWNENSHAQITKPKVEDSCRDRLIDFLTPHLQPLGIRAEPEGHMSMDKRSDIVLLDAVKLKLPLELKKMSHKDLWTACENQLKNMYARDPQALGYGVYVVFWFGKTEHCKLKPPPKKLGISKPQSAKELETALRKTIPPDETHKIEVVVIDVSTPYGYAK